MMTNDRHPALPEQNDAGSSIVKPEGGHRVSHRKAKVVIVDDTAVNLDATREAAKGFPEHEFVFLTDAADALEMLSGVDALITDLFFPEEWDRKLTGAYNAYVNEISAENPAWREIYWDFYSRRMCDEDEILARHQRGLREGIPDPTRPGCLQFAYGGALMLAAKSAGKKSCLVTNLHRHDREMDGVTVLMPLISSGIASYEEVRCDGDVRGAVMGSDAIGIAIVRAHGKCSREEVDRGKTNPVVWAEAIRRVLSQ